MVYSHVPFRPHISNFIFDSKKSRRNKCAKFCCAKKRMQKKSSKVFDYLVRVHNDKLINIYHYGHELNSQIL